MSDAQLRYDNGDMPTEEQNDHEIHKAEGDMYQWCRICVEEEICPKCEAQEPAMKDCPYCETSGRRLPCSK